MVLAIRRDGDILRVNLQDQLLKGGDRLLLQADHQSLEAVSKTSGFKDIRRINHEEIKKVYHLYESLMLITIPHESNLDRKTLKESRMAEVLGMRVLYIIGKDGIMRMPDPMDTIFSGDQLLVEGSMSDLEALHALEELEVDQHTQPNLEKLVSDKVGLTETILSPHSTLAGKTLRQLNFREKFGFIAFWGLSLPAMLSLLTGWSALILNAGFVAIIATILFYYKKRIGCITGDMLGAITEVTEAGLFLLASMGGI